MSNYDQAIQALYDGMPTSQQANLEIVEAYLKAAEKRARELEAQIDSLFSPIGGE